MPSNASAEGSGNPLEPIIGSVLKKVEPIIGSIMNEVGGVVHKGEKMIATVKGKLFSKVNTKIKCWLRKV